MIATWPDVELTSSLSHLLSLTLMDRVLPQPIDFATSPVDPAWPLAFTDATVSYAQELFASRLALPGAPAPRASDILGLDFRREIQHRVDV